MCRQGTTGPLSLTIGDLFPPGSGAVLIFSQEPTPIAHRLFTPALTPDEMNWRAAHTTPLPLTSLVMANLIKSKCAASLPLHYKVGFLHVSSFTGPEGSRGPCQPTSSGRSFSRLLKGEGSHPPSFPFFSLVTLILLVLLVRPSYTSPHLLFCLRSSPRSFFAPLQGCAGSLSITYNPYHSYS